MAIVQLIQQYNFNSVLIATAICILTGLIKIPIKALASKTKDSSKYTKYITFLPLVLGFAITALYEYIVTQDFHVTEEFIILWMTSSSLSLAIYAFIEKFIPSKKKILSAEEIKQNKDMIDKLKDRFIKESEQKTIEEEGIKQNKTKEIKGNSLLNEVEIAQSEQQVVSDTGVKKIILRGKKNG